MVNIIRNGVFGTIVFYFQLFLMPRISMFGIIPDLYIPFVIILGQKDSLIDSVPLILFFGIAGDLFYPELLGLHTFGLIISVIFVHKYHQSINKEKFISVISSIAIIIIFMTIINFSILFGTIKAKYFLFFRYFSYNLIITTFSVYFYAVISRLRLYIDV